MYRGIVIFALTLVTYCVHTERSGISPDAIDAYHAEGPFELIDAPHSDYALSDEAEDEREEAVDASETADEDLNECGVSMPEIEVRLCRVDAATCPRIEEVPVPHLRGLMQLSATLSCVPDGLMGITIDVGGVATSCANEADCTATIDTAQIGERVVSVNVDAAWTGSIGAGAHRALELPIYDCGLSAGHHECLRYGPWEEAILLYETESTPAKIDVLEQTDGLFHVYSLTRSNSSYPSQYTLDVFVEKEGGSWAHEALPIRPADEGAWLGGIPRAMAVSEEPAGFELVIWGHWSGPGTLNGDVALGRRKDDVVTIVPTVSVFNHYCALGNVSANVGLSAPFSVYTNDAPFVGWGESTYDSVASAFVDGIRHVLFSDPTYYISAPNDTEWSCEGFPANACPSFAYCSTLIGRQAMKPDGRGGLVTVSNGRGGFVLGRYNGSWMFSPLACDPGCWDRYDVSLALDGDGRAHVFSAVPEAVGEPQPWVEILSHDAIEVSGTITHENLTPLIEQLLGQLPEAYDSSWPWGLDSDVDACGRIHTVFTLNSPDNDIDDALVELTDLTGQWTMTPFFASPPHRLLGSGNLASHSSFHITPDGTEHLFAVRKRDCPVPLDCNAGSTQLSHWFRRCEVYLED
jgi:hypothetical protein